MRKMIVRCQMSGFIRSFYTEDFFTVVKSLELIKIIRLDMQEGRKLGIAKVTCHSRYSVKDIRFPPGAEIITVFHENGEEAIILFQGTAPERYRKIGGMFLQDIIWTTPTAVTGDQIIYSIIGSENELKMMLRLTRVFLGEIIDVSYEKATFGPYDLVQTLTRKQQDILILAKSEGYYENPRRVTLEDLSIRAGLSKATVAEHLRKAENQIINSVLAGY